MQTVLSNKPRPKNGKLQTAIFQPTASEALKDGGLVKQVTDRVRMQEAETANSPQTSRTVLKETPSK